MKKIRKLSLGILTIICLLTFVIGLFAQKTNRIGIIETSFIVINEIETNNPGAENNACNYIELRGDPNSAVTVNINTPVYLVEFEGDAGENPGNADFVREITTETFGSNGILTVRGTGTCGSRSYTANGGIEITDSGASLEQGTITFMIIQTAVAPGVASLGGGAPAIVEGTDYDLMDTGMLSLPAISTIIDRVGWTVGGVGDFVYGGVDITPGTGTPMAASRNDGDTTPSSASAWFADDLVGGASGVAYDQTNLTSNLGPGFIIDFITPGARNLAPSAAPGTISGRARTTKGRGIKHAVIMLTGGDLEQPIYATTNQFGNYRFEDVPVGQSYSMQIFSGRHTFVNSSRIINLGDSITNEDFVTETPRVIIQSGTKRSQTPRK